MKRDIEVVRNILIEYEHSPENAFEERLATMNAVLLVKSGSEQERQNQMKAEHIRWMIDEGLLVKIGGDTAFFVRVTAKGCDYLDAIRDEGIWAKTKKAAWKEADRFAFFITGFASALGIGIESSLSLRHDRASAVRTLLPFSSGASSCALLMRHPKEGRKAVLRCSFERYHSPRPEQTFIRTFCQATNVSSGLRARRGR